MLFLIRRFCDGGVWCIESGDGGIIQKIDDARTQEKYVQGNQCSECTSTSIDVLFALVLLRYLESTSSASGGEDSKFR